MLLGPVAVRPTTEMLGFK